MKINYPMVVLVLGIILVGQPAAAEVLEVDTDDNWCDVVNDAQPGDEVVLLPGDHMDTCHIRARGTEEQPVVIRSEDPEDPARLAYSGTGANTIEFRSESEHVVLRNLHFPGTAGPHAIRFHSPTDITVENNHFENIGGVTMSANFSDSNPKRLNIVDNTLFDLETTAIYFGCHGGIEDCHVTDARIEGNTIYGLESPGVGYGIQIKVDSNAEIRDNAIFDTQGPGIMVYGAHQDDIAPSVIDGNLVVGSRTSGPILVGGGPAVVTNNIVADGNTHGLHIYRHGEGAAHDGTFVAHNTVLENEGTAIQVSDWADGADNVLVNNAIAPGADNDIGGGADGLVEGNVTCDDPDDCFFAAADTPFSVTPLADGPLAGASSSGDDRYPDSDFMGHQRGDETFAGALERADDEGDPWFEIGHSRPDRVGEPDDGDGDDGGSSGGETEGEEEMDTDSGSEDPAPDAGCGCAAAGPAPGGVLTALIVLMVIAAGRQLEAASPIGP